MNNKTDDSISIVWHIDDIKEVDDTLTDDQAREVLQRLKNDHDAGIGINWDVIYYTIDAMKEGLEL